MPAEVDWTEPTGGFLTWLTLPEELDTLDLRPAAVAAGVAYVPGRPFHVGDNGRNALRLSFSHLTETELETAAERLAAVVRGALEQANAGSPAGRL
jgi:2-aminoadipate transaminase